MNIYETIVQNQENIKSVYDLAAVCYDYLLTQIENQIIFIGKYTEFSDDNKQNNPNQKNLLKFCDSVKALLFSVEYWNDEILDEILSMTLSAENKLKPFREAVYNEAAIAYFLLLGIDLYAECQPENNQNAPLNQSYQVNSFIYRRRKTSILSYAAEEIGFREIIQAVEIRNNFNCLIFLEKSEMKPGMLPPKMVTLSIDKEDFTRNSLIQDQMLKVVCIPWGKEQTCNFPKIQGNTFCVEYLDSYKTTCATKALTLLEAAIRCKANIIIFPEYVCCPEVQEAIGTYLRETYLKAPEKMGALLMVIAGSGWTDDDNNVAEVFSYSGKLLGKYYKYAAYDDREMDLQTGMSKERLIEGLHDPGKESVIVDVPNVGIVMTAICRDISNWDYSEKIARLFRTDFLMVPAWSGSLNHAFINQLISITAANTNTCAVVCNCCGAQKSGSLEKGVVVTPYKENTRMTGKLRFISLNKMSVKKCSDCKGCIFSLTFSFKPQDVEKGRIARSIRNFKP